LIARQRDNLKQTFALAEQTNPGSRAIAKLTQAERELADVTAEFTTGLEKRAGPVPCLHDAIDAMQLAVAALTKQQLAPARGYEETALANLIKARQNIRQFLSQKSSCASACRKFDQQQRQKLRTPPKKDDKAEQGKLQHDLEKLAQEEKKIAQELAAKSSGPQLDQKPEDSPKGSSSGQSSSDKSSSGSSSGTGKPSESKPSLSERQEKAAEKAEELKQLVRKNEKLTDLARARMDKAAGDVRSSADSLKQGLDAEAAKKAADAAEQLERLAKQVAALTAPELTTRLAHGQNMARQLGREQEALDKELRDRNGSGSKGQKGKGDQAAKERGLSEEARTLADLLKKLQPEADAANPQLGRDLRQATEANSPSKAAEQLRHAADALQAGKMDQAARDVNGSGRSMNELAQQLDAARRAAVQPQLEKLLAAEKQAAETKKTLDSVNTDRQKADAEKKVADLRDTLNGLKNADGKLADATDALDQAVRGGNPSAWQIREPHDPRLGTYVPPREYDDNIRKAVQALQSKIQDIILKDILLDKDEPVPPQFKALVEEYYRVLSDDTR
jgi:DNA repair exonuclease SbcCD ATPase subunit